MYLGDTLKVSGCCDDFYRGFDALKKSIFIGDVYVAVALRGFHGLPLALKSLILLLLELGEDLKHE
jgi:hypothetical protein